MSLSAKYAAASHASRFGWRTLLLFLALLPFCAPAALALDPDIPVEQYSMLSWRAADGLPFEWAEGFAQTPDGYLWISTQYGIARFDGARFENYTTANTPVFRTNVMRRPIVDSRGRLLVPSWGDGLYVYQTGSWSKERMVEPRLVTCVGESSGQVLWVGTTEGLIRVTQRGPTRYTTANGLPSNYILDVTAGRRGEVWVATTAGVARFDGVKWLKYDAEHGFPPGPVRSVLVDASGAVWAGTHSTLLRLTGERWSSVFLETTDATTSILQDRDGNLWFAMQGAGVKRLSNGRWSTLKRTGTERIRAVFEDRDGNLWLATGGSGIARLSDSPFEVLDARSGLKSSRTHGVLHLPDGRTIFSTDAGIEIARRGVPLNEQRLQLIPGITPQCMIRDRKGTVWLAGVEDGLLLLDGDHVKPFRPAGDPVPANTFCVAESRDGAIWIVAAEATSVYRDGRLRNYAAIDDAVTFIHPDDDGEMLFGTFGSGLLRTNGGNPGKLTRIEALGDKTLLSVWDDGQSLWIGSGSSGLYRRKDGAWKQIDASRGLHDNTVIAVTGDDRGFLWISSRTGIFRVSKSQTSAVMDGSQANVVTEAFSHSDGLAAGHCYAEASPKAPLFDGRIWFATYEGVAVVDPARVRPDTDAPPAVHLEELILDGVAHPLREDRVTIPSGVRRIEFHFTAPSFRAPDRMRFAYFLEGSDPSWVAARSDRTAHYMNLKPGHYTLRIRAWGGGGGPQGSLAVPVEVRPRFYQERWFIITTIALLLAAGLTLYRIRTRMLRHRAARLERLVGERTAALNAATQELEKLAVTDPLTGIANRRRLLEWIGEEWRRLERAQRPLTLMMIDVDHFKAFNDRYGHLEGDRCLAQVAAALNAVCRRVTDRCGRYGGEEFTILLPDTDERSGLELAREACAAVSRLEVPHEFSSHCIVTVSVGVATIVPSGDTTPDILIGRADAALYRAKQNGRNRCEAYDAERDERHSCSLV